MKKKEKPTQKPKEFSAAPFQALKGVTVKREEKAPAPPPKAAPPKRDPTQKELDDAALFFEAVAGVKRMHSAPAAAGKRTPSQPKPSRDEEEKRLFLQAIEALRMDVRFDEEPPEQQVRPAPVNRLRQVRRGTLRIDLQLDLHGLTRDEAVENLERFVKGAYGRGQKGVLVITGKGNNSPGEPVLKQAVSAWLREAGKQMVSEFVVAPKDMGGGGAFVVFLREKKPPEEE